MKTKTKFAEAWETFKRDPGFEGLVDTSTLGQCFERRFMENRLHRAFTEGWNAKTSSVLDALNEMQKKEGGANNGGI